MKLFQRRQQYSLILGGKMSTKGILITGGAGFIGSTCISFLNKQGINNIYVVDALGKDDKWKNLRSKRFLEFIPIDSLFEWLTPCRIDELQAVIHLGACSSTREKDCDYLIQNNTLFSQKLAHVAVENNLRFIYASSAATYGMGEQGFSDTHSTLQTLCPANMYGFSKHLFDLWMHQQGYLDCSVALKYFNVFGPNEWHKGGMSSHILRMLPQAQGGEIRLFKSNDSAYKDGEQKRDFIYVKDAAAMTCHFLNDLDSSGVFNIGSGIPESWNTLAQAVMKSIKLDVPIEYIDMPEDLAKQYQNYTCADMSKYKSLQLAPQPSYCLHDAVDDYIQNHLLLDSYY